MHKNKTHFNVNIILRHDGFKMLCICYFEQLINHLPMSEYINPNRMIY